MTRWFTYAILLIVVFFIGGWTLVELSGYGGNRTGGSSVVWHAGGLMVYASIICVPIWLLAGIVALAVKLMVHGSRSAGGASARL